MVTAEQAGRLGAWGVIASMQPNFDALWGGRRRHVRAASRRRPSRGLNPLALLASQGVPLAFGSDSPGDRHGSVGDGSRGDPAPDAGQRGLGAGGVRGRDPRARGAPAASRDGVTGTLVPGAPASYAVWEADEFEVSAPADAVQRWSTDPRSRVPALPRLDPTTGCRGAVQTVHRGAVIHG